MKTNDAGNKRYRTLKSLTMGLLHLYCSLLLLLVVLDVAVMVRATTSMSSFALPLDLRSCDKDDCSVMGEGTRGTRQLPIDWDSERYGPKYGPKTRVQSRDGMHPEYADQEIAAPSSVEEALDSCLVEETDDDHLHFRAISQVVGNDGMLHFGTFFNLTTLLTEHIKYCKLPQMTVEVVEKHYPNSSERSKPHSPHYHPPSIGLSDMYDGLAYTRWTMNVLQRRCGYMLEETLSLYHTFYSKFNQDGVETLEPELLKQVTEAQLDYHVTNQEQPVFMSFLGRQMYSEDYKRFGKMVPYSNPDCVPDPYDSGPPLHNNPYGDAYEIATWEKIRDGRLPYDFSMVPLRNQYFDRDLWDHVCRPNTSAFEAIIRDLETRGERLHAPSNMDGETEIKFGHRPWFRGSLNPWPTASTDPWRSASTTPPPSLSMNRTSWYSGAVWDADRKRKRELVKRATRAGVKWFDKRFIFTILLTILAVGSVLFTAYELNKMAEKASGEIGNHNIDSTVRLFNEHDHSIRVNAAAIASLNRTMAHLQDMMGRNFADIRTALITERVSLAMQAYFDEQRRLLRGLGALTRHRLPNELVNSRRLTQTLITVQKQMRKKGYNLGLSSFADMFRLDTSYILYANGTLFMVTHLPIYRQNTRFTLYEYERTGYIELGGHAAFRIEAEADLVAVSEDGQNFQVFTWGDIDRCSNVGSLRMCPDANIINTEPESSCLIALYKAEEEHIMDLCKYEAAVRKDYVLQLDGNRFLVRTLEEATVSFTCDFSNDFSIGTQGGARYKSAKTVNTTVITVPGGCKAFVGTYVLEGRLEFSVETTKYKTHYISTKGLFPEVTEFFGSKNWSWGDLVESFDVFDPNKVTFRNCNRNFKRYQADLWSGLLQKIIGFVVIGFICMLVLVLIIKCCVPMCMDCCRERRAQGGGVPPRWRWRRGASDNVMDEMMANFRQYGANMQPYLNGRRPETGRGVTSEAPAEDPERQSLAGPSMTSREREMRPLSPSQGGRQQRGPETPPPSYRQGSPVDNEVNPVDVEGIIRAAGASALENPNSLVARETREVQSEAGAGIAQNSKISEVLQRADLPPSMRSTVQKEVEQITREAQQNTRENQISLNAMMNRATQRSDQENLSAVRCPLGLRTGDTAPGVERSNVALGTDSAIYVAPPPVPPPRPGSSAAKVGSSESQSIREGKREIEEAKAQVATWKWSTFEKRTWVQYARLLIKARDPAVAVPPD